MKSKAPWTDRTGNARGGLTAYSEVDRGQYAIVLAHGVPYGIYLETRWSGRYAIIIPTMQEMGPGVMSDLTGIMAKMPRSAGSRSLTGGWQDLFGDVFGNNGGWGEPLFRG